jgi:type VI secretion system protein ImpG
VVAAAARTARWTEVLPGTSISRVGFGDDEGLLPYDKRSFQGYRLLHEYFAFPRRFSFLKIAGVAPALAKCEQNLVDVIVMFTDENPELEGAIDATNFALHATPAVNLFPKRADRIFVSDRASEFHVVVDRTRPLDFEVYRVEGVTGYGSGSEEVRKFSPFYAARDVDGGEGSGAFFAVQRMPRAISEREQRTGRRSTYPGSEVFISLVDSADAPFSNELRQLGVETLCSNRDLPLQMPVGRGQTDFTLDLGAPVASIRVVAGPTAPRPSHAEPRGTQTEGESVWRLISHLSLNYLSLMDSPGALPSDPSQGSASLRDLLRLYADTSDASVRKQVEGVRNISSKPIARRVDSPGPINFARGLEVTLTMDESQFEGTGVFILGAVLERFFAGYVSLNSFTETVIRTVERGDIMRWPARLGRRQLL